MLVMHLRPVPHPVAPYVDVWCPVAHHVESRPEGLAFMRSTGKPIWTYMCGSGKGVTPMTNRVLPWLAFRYDLQGCTYWTYMSGYGDLWDDTDGTQSDWTKIYPGLRGVPVSSRRWEAWREGLEDYCLLRALRERAAGAPGEEVDQDVLDAVNPAVDAAVTAVLENR